MVRIGCLGTEGGSLLGEGFLADVTKGRQFNVSGLDKWLQTWEMSMYGDVAKADEADAGRRHGNPVW
jgi:hypothetical protein